MRWSFKDGKDLYPGSARIADGSGERNINIIKKVGHSTFLVEGRQELKNKEESLEDKTNPDAWHIQCLTREAR